MNLSRLSASGITTFTTYLANLEAEPSLKPPTFLLDDPDQSEEIRPHVSILQRQFNRRLDAAMYLDQLLSTARVSRPEADLGLWAWLTLFYFDQVCPPRPDGTRKLLELWRHVPAIGNFQKFYRHLLLGPFVVLRAHEGDLGRVSAILANRLHVTDDLMEQVAGYQDLIANPTVLSVQTSLYFDQLNQALKDGARSKGPGSPRRLASVLRQFDLTYDLFGMPAGTLLSLLPSEFDRFRT